MTLLLLFFKQTGTNWTELLLLTSLCILVNLVFFKARKETRVNWERGIFYKKQIITLSHVTGIVP